MGRGGGSSPGSPNKSKSLITESVLLVDPVKILFDKLLLLLFEKEIGRELFEIIGGIGGGAGLDGTRFDELNVWGNGGRGGGLVDGCVFGIADDWGINEGSNESSNNENDGVLLLKVCSLLTKFSLNY